MSSVEFKFCGLMAPVFTPFDENGELHLGLIPEYAKYLHDNGINGVLVNGTTGEGVSMTTKERLDVVNEWVKASALFGQTVMVQVGGTNMADVKTLAREAEKAKVSSILCLADLFFRPSTVDDLLKYLNIVSKEAPSTPLLYYHIPSFTGINAHELETKTVLFGLLSICLCLVDSIIAGAVNLFLIYFLGSLMKRTKSSQTFRKQ